MSTPHHKPRRISRLAPYPAHKNGYNWVLDPFSDPTELKEKKSEAKKRAALKWKEKNQK